MVFEMKLALMAVAFGLFMLLDYYFIKREFYKGMHEIREELEIQCKRARVMKLDIDHIAYKARLTQNNLDVTDGISAELNKRVDDLSSEMKEVRNFRRRRPKTIVVDIPSENKGEKVKVSHHLDQEKDPKDSHTHPLGDGE